MCLRELAIVDDTLEALGEPKEYQRLRNWIIRIIIGWIAYILYQLAYYNYLVFFVFNFDINFILFFSGFYLEFLERYPSHTIILNVLISATILELVLCVYIYFVSYFYWHCASKCLQCETHKDLLVPWKMISMSINDHDNICMFSVLSIQNMYIQYLFWALKIY